MKTSAKRVAVVTGGNRGIGFEVCRQMAAKGYKVVLTSRDEARGRAAAERLAAEGLDVVYHQMDVTDPASVDRLRDFIVSELGRVDALVNNAGVLLDGPIGSEASVFAAKIETARATMEVNVYGALRVAQALVPLMRTAGYGRVVNMSSGLGQLKHMSGNYPAYRISKTALNAVTRMLAGELAGTNVLVNSASPGWVRTDMGGPNAPKTPAEGADTLVWLATLPDGGPTGGFFKDRREIEW